MRARAARVIIALTVSGCVGLLAPGTAAAVPFACPLVGVLGVGATAILNPAGGTLGCVVIAGAALTLDGVVAAVAVETALLGTTTYTYDAGDRVATSTRPDGRVTAYTYDDTPSRIQAITDTDGRTAAYTYDASDRLVTIDDTQEPITTTYQYDSVHRVSQIDASPGGRVTTYTYDSSSRLESATDTQGPNTEYFYDSGGRLERVENDLGHVTRYEYDAGDRLIRETVDDLATERITRYHYDALDRVIRVAGPSGLVTTYIYDTGGRLLSAATVPEPRVLLLIGLGLAVLVRRRRPAG